MTRLLRLAVFALMSQAFVSAASQPNDDAAAAAGLLGCLGCGTVFLIIPLILFVVQIALLVWVARDAKSRGMDNAVLWMIFVFVVPIIGLVVYLFSRPQGNLIKCASCGNNRLEAAVKCPHCGN
jgi:uncharacterized membrane protein YhaH (DUF805 family)